MSSQPASEEGVAPVDELLERVAGWGRERPDVLGIILIGSQARASRVADRWSDVDLLIVCRSPARLLQREDWLQALGEPRISFVEPTPVGGASERRVLLASGLDVDLAVVPGRLLRFARLMSSPLQQLLPPSVRRGARERAAAIASVMRPGYRVLLDKGGLIEKGLLPAIARELEQPARPAGERELNEIASDFWYHAVWTAKKLGRGELWMAKMCCDGTLKQRIVEALSLGREWPDGLPPGRFVDERLDAETATLLRDSFALYDPADVARALSCTAELFARVVHQASERLGLLLDARIEQTGRAQVERLLALRESLPERG